MTYSEPSPEQEIEGQDAAEESVEPGKNQGDPLLEETEGGDASAEESQPGSGASASD